MDKYEYKVKFDQMKTFSAGRDYKAAAEIADTINWHKIKNVNELLKAGEIYEKAGRYEESKEVLLLAYDRSPIGRMIIYRLAQVAIKMGNFAEAHDYYEEFVEIAPHDNLKYILKYEIAKAEGEDATALIPILEELKEQEYTEEWAYELATLYHKAGQVDKCIEACDELILWFGDGPYVERALELKMLYQPLTKQQEEKYRQFRQRKEGIIEVRPEDNLASGEIVSEPVKIPDVKLSPERFNTQNLQKELQKSMQQIMEATEKETVADSMDNIKKLVEDIPYLQIPREEPPKEQTADMPHIETDAEIDSSLKTNFKELLGEESDGQISLHMEGGEATERQITGQLSIDEVLAEWEKTKNAAKTALKDADQRKLESAKARALQEAEGIMERLVDAIPKLDSGLTPKDLLEEQYLGNKRISNDTAAEMVANMNERLQEEIDRLSMENAQMDEQLAAAGVVPAGSALDGGQQGAASSRALQNDGDAMRDAESGAAQGAPLEGEAGPDGAEGFQQPDGMYGWDADGNPVWAREAADLAYEIPQDAPLDGEAPLNPDIERVTTAAKLRMPAFLQGLGRDTKGVPGTSSALGESGASGGYGIGGIDSGIGTESGVGAEGGVGAESDNALGIPDAYGVPEPVGSGIGAVEAPEGYGQGGMAESEGYGQEAAPSPEGYGQGAYPGYDQGAQEAYGQPMPGGESQGAFAMPDDRGQAAFAGYEQPTPDDSGQAAFAGYEQPMPGGEVQDAAPSSEGYGQEAFSDYEQPMPGGKMQGQELTGIGEGATGLESQQMPDASSLEQMPSGEVQDAAPSPEGYGQEAFAGYEPQAPVEEAQIRKTAAALGGEGLAAGLREQAQPFMEGDAQGAFAGSEQPMSSASDLGQMLGSEQPMPVASDPGQAPSGESQVAFAASDDSDQTAFTGYEQPTPGASDLGQMPVASDPGQTPGGESQAAMAAQGAPVAAPSIEEQVIAESVRDIMLEPEERPSRQRQRFSSPKPPKMAGAEAAGEPGAGAGASDAASQPQGADQRTKALGEAGYKAGTRGQQDARRDGSRQDAQQDGGRQPAQKRAPAKEDSLPLIRKLSKEQREIFTYFVPIRGMERQICQAMTGAARRLAAGKPASTGNLVIQGAQGSGKTVLATCMIKALQRETGKLKGRIGKIEASVLNKRDLSSLLQKVAGGCLIIEKAGDLSKESEIRLSTLLSSDQSGLLVIIEDTGKGVSRALALDSGFAARFSEKITIPIFTSDELVSFARAYANELGYTIDEMGELALQNSISSIQRPEQETTLAEVKEIVDDAISHSERGGIKKAFRIITSKRYDDEDYVILREKDFG